MEFGRVDPPWWDDRPVALIGTGPSLKGFDFVQFEETACHLVAVKNAMFDLPYTDAIFGLDFQWVKKHNSILEQLAADHRQVYLSVMEPSVKGAIHLRFRQTQEGGLSDDPGVIECGFNSGYGALNLAYLKGARQIVLFGYDYRGGHYCPERYPEYRPHEAWESWGAHFSTTLEQLERRRIEVVCASPDSAITCFRRVSVEEGLRMLQ